MAEKGIIEKNFREFFEIAEYSFRNKKFNVSVTLYYKALVELCDMALLDKLGRIGANHRERFELLEENSPKLYSIASRLFRFYRDSYSKEISATIAKLVREEVKNAERIVFDKGMDKEE